MSSYLCVTWVGGHPYHVSTKHDSVTKPTTWMEEVQSFALLIV